METNSDVLSDDANRLSRRLGLKLMVAGCWLGPDRERATGTPPPRTGWDVGCFTRPWDEYEYPVALDQIAAAGFKYAGLMTARTLSKRIITPETTVREAAAISQEVQARGLRLLATYSDFGASGTHDEAVASVRRLIDCCETLKSPILLLGGTADPQQYEPYYRAIAACCDAAANQGVTLTIKPHGGSNATGPACRRAIEQVNHPAFRLFYDPGNILYYSNGQLDPVADATSVDGLVVGMSVKDFQPPREVLVNPGSGRVDFPRVLKTLHAGGFTRGPLVIECLEPGDLPQLAARARATRAFVEELAVAI